MNPKPGKKNPCCKLCFNVDYLLNTAGVRCNNPSCPSCHSLPKTAEKCHGRNCRKCNGGDSSICYLSDNTPQPEKKCDHEEGFRCNRCRDTQIVNNDFKKPTSEKKKCACVDIGKPYPKYCSKHLKEHITPPPLASEWEVDDLCQRLGFEKQDVRRDILNEYAHLLLLRQQDEIVRKVNEMKKKHGTIHNPHEAWNNGYNQALNDFITNIKNK